MGSIEVKVKKLDAELGVFKAQMAKMRDGPGKVSGVSLPS
jgi:charged multivesicular body protein 5